MMKRPAFAAGTIVLDKNRRERPLHERSFRLFVLDDSKICGIRSCKMKIKDLLQISKKDIFVCAWILFFFIGFLLFIRNDYFLYCQTIVRVTDVKESSSAQDFAQEFRQEITGLILNGEYKGKIATYTNVRDDSGAFDLNIKAGDELFVSLDKTHNISGVSDFKRDFYIALITEILILSLVILGRKKGLRTFITLLLNVFIFYGILFLRGKGVRVLLLYSIASILFIVLTLLIISGRNLKTACAILSSILSLFVTMVIAFTVIRIYKQSICFEWMPFAIKMPDYQDVFYAGILIGGLGAIMEISIAVSSAIQELMTKKPDITVRELRASGGNIAADMMGALINVLLFTFMIGTVPMLTLAMANDLPIGLALSYFANLEIIRSLVGAIGIVLTVPITLYITIFIQKKGGYR